MVYADNERRMKKCTEMGKTSAKWSFWVKLLRQGKDKGQRAPKITEDNFWVLNCNAQKFKG